LFDASRSTKRRKAEITEIDPSEVAARLDHSRCSTFESPKSTNRVPCRRGHVPRGNLEFSVEGRLPDKNARSPFTARGRALAFAAKTLQTSATPTRVSIIGGFNSEDEDSPDDSPVLSVRSAHP